MEYSMSLGANSIICIITGSVSIDWFFFLLFMDGPFLAFCKVGNFWMDAKHCEFHPVSYWIFLYSYKNFPALFHKAVTCKPFNSFRSGFSALFGGTRAAFSLGLVFSLSWDKALQSILSDAHELWGFCTPAGGDRNYFLTLDYPRKLFFLILLGDHSHACTKTQGVPL